MKKQYKIFAFTLIEVLIVTAIVAMISATIAACLSAGIRAWEEAYRFGTDERHVLLGLEMMEKDIINLLPFTGIGISGMENQIVFATPPVKKSYIARGELPSQFFGINVVKYFWNREKKAIYRKEWHYPEEENLANTGELLIRNVDAFKLEYYKCASSGTGVGEWKSEWNSRTNFPCVVRVTVDIGKQSKEIQLKRTIVLPAFMDKVTVNESTKRQIGK